MTHRVTRLPGLRRGVSALAVTFPAIGAALALGAPAQAASPVRASQPLVALLGDHVARTRPNGHARRIETVAARRPLTGVRTLLPVLGERISSNGNPWLRVRLPGRPNSHAGWIAASRTRRTATAWHLRVKLSDRRVTVFRDGRAMRRFRAVVGHPSTPTPTGRFFVEEALALPSNAAGGPFALAASARSNVLQEYGGGPGQIALHGTDFLSDPLGTAASHGCIRLSTRSITWLARRIGSGVPLTIER